ncbi:hypothetical protein R1flu_015998 [Riccia fluitans]|uniref:Uncharacterized protein n=1 Tax=Riccia fluitans TaxID=41844 RepID=A0ABD1YPF4_9MARC
MNFPHPLPLPFANPKTPSRAFRAGERATGSKELAGALRWPADALRMAARRAASALRAGAAALLTAALLAAALRTANTLKRPRGRFRVREWEKERESGEALGGAVRLLAVRFSIWRRLVWFRILTT